MKDDLEAIRRNARDLGNSFDGANKEFQQSEKSMRELAKEANRLRKALAQATDPEEQKRLTAEINRTETAMSALGKSTRRNAALTRQLKNESEDMNRELHQATDPDRARKLQKGLQRVNRELKDIKRSSNQAADEMRRVGNSAERMETGFRRLGVAIGAAFALDRIRDFGREVITRFAGFDQAQAEVRALTRAGEEQMETMRNLAKQLGGETRFSAQQAADAQATLARAGLTVNEIQGVLPGVLQLAAAGNLDLAEASEIATGALGAYGLEVDEITRINDVFAKTANSATTTVGELGSAFRVAAPVTSALGVPVEELSAALGVLAEQQIRGAEAGTALRSGLSRLIDPPKDAQRALERLGVQLRDSEGQFVGLVDLFRQFEAAGADARDMVQIFGVQQGGRFTALLNKGADAIAGMNEELLNSQGFAEETAKIMEDNLQGDIRRLNSAWESFTNELAEGNKGALRDLIQTIAELLGYLANWLRGTQATMEQQEAFNNVMETVRQGAELLLAAFLALTKTGRRLSQQFVNLGKAVLRTGKTFGRMLGSVSKFRAGLRASGRSLKAFRTSVVATGKAIARAFAPIVILEGILALRDAIGSLTDDFDAAKETAESFKREMMLVNDEIQRQQNEMNDLFQALKNVGDQQGEKAKIIKQLNEQYGEYLGNLDLERASIHQISIIQRRANEALADQLRLKALNAEMEELGERRASVAVDARMIQAELDAEAEQISGAMDEAEEMLGTVGREATGILTMFTHGIGRAMDEGELADLENAMDAYSSQMENLQAEIDEITQRQGTVTMDEFLENMSLALLRKGAEEEGEEVGEAYAQGMQQGIEQGAGDGDGIAEATTNALKQGAEEAKAALDQLFAELEAEYQQERDRIAEQFLAGTTTEEQYNEAIERLDREHLQDRIDLRNAYNMQVRSLLNEQRQAEVRERQELLKELEQLDRREFQAQVNIQQRGGADQQIEAARRIANRRIQEEEATASEIQRIEMELADEIRDIRLTALEESFDQEAAIYNLQVDDIRRHYQNREDIIERYYDRQLELAQGNEELLADIEEQRTRALEENLQQRTDAIQAAAEREINIWSNMQAEIFGVAQEWGEMRLQNLENRAQRRENKLNEQRERELAAVGNNERRRAEINARFNQQQAAQERQLQQERERIARRQLRLEKAQYTAETAIKIAQAIQNANLSATNTLASTPFPANIGFAATVLSLGLGWVTKMRQTPQAFKEGGWVERQNGERPGIDTVSARLTEGEFVLTKEAAGKWADYLEAINAGNLTPEQFAQSFTPLPDFTPMMLSASKGEARPQASFSIDYKRLGKEVGKQVPQVQLQVDEDGFYVRQERFRKRQTIKRTRYGAKR
jgi:TP901 family phage tail tape measure protein